MKKLSYYICALLLAISLVAPVCGDYSGCYCDDSGIFCILPDPVTVVK